MPTCLSGYRRLTSALVCGWLLCTPLAEANSVQGTVVLALGDTQLKRAGISSWVSAADGTDLYAGDRLHTGGDGRLAVLMADETLLQLGKNSSLLIKQIDPSADWQPQKVSEGSSGGSRYSLDSGLLWLLNKQRKADIEIETPTITAAIRGTEIRVQAGESESLVSVLEGGVEVFNPFGQLNLLAGEEAYAAKGSAPVKRLLLNPDNAVQWTVYIPPVFQAASFNQLAAQPLAGERDQLREALQLAQQSRYLEALAHVKNITEQSPLSSVVYAWLLLLIGEQDRAWDLLEQHTPNDHPAALALQSLIALLRNDAPLSLSLAERLTTIQPEYAEGWLVLAYAQQALFDLPAAGRSLDQLLSLDPDHLQARLLHAQLQFANGFTEQAFAEAEQLTRRYPDSADALNLRGFVQLARQQTQQARLDFLQAIQLDPTLPEPNVGLSLAAMRSNDSNEALQAISRAVLLSPRRSLYRSYWAKMLYSLERHQKALEVLGIAQQLDRKDPTPAFYRALVLRDLNRPHEALAELHHATALNNNRAVYRSRFLLDKDLAVKNIDQSIIYEQLGLHQWAQAQATESLRLDMNNPSAHLFYSGALSRQSDRFWAANTELLFARILQPANLNAFNSFNDYTDFLDRPDTYVELHTGVGNNSQRIYETLVTGADPQHNLAYQFGYLKDDTDGWRSTYDEGNKTLVGRIKWDPTERDKLSFVLRRTDSYAHDTEFQRDEIDATPRPLDRRDQRSDLIEIGYHHQISPMQQLLVQAAYGQNDGNSFVYECFLAPGPCTTSIFDEDRLRLAQETPYHQLQGLWLGQFSNHQPMVGAGYYEGKQKLNAVLQSRTSGPPLPPPPPPETIQGDARLRFQTLYVHDIWSVTDTTSAEGGVYYEKMRIGDAFSGLSWAEEEVNFRGGLSTRLTESVSIHAAAFRYLVPYIIDPLSPSFVAGIPVYRNGYDGSLTREEQIMLRYNSGQGLVQGAAYQRRNRLRISAAVPGADDLLQDIDGISLGWNRYFDNAVGISLTHDFLNIRGNDPNVLPRDEQISHLNIRQIGSSGWSLGGNITHRALLFDGSSRPDESITVVDVSLRKELLNKKINIGVVVDNLFDKQFNWVVDPFTFERNSPTRQWRLELTLRL